MKIDVVKNTINSNNKHVTAQENLLKNENKESVKKIDFTRMTTKELISVVNGKLKSGEMSFDDSSAFLYLTLKVKIPENVKSLDNSSCKINDDEVIDFMGMVQNAISGAVSRGDENTRKAMNFAFEFMSKTQGDIIGIDVKC